MPLPPVIVTGVPAKWTPPVPRDPDTTIDLSPSQLETYLDCARKWAFQKVDGLRSPSSPAAAFGSAVHDVLEKWLGSAQPIPLPTREGAVAFALVKHLPVPKTEGLEVEQWFDFWMGPLHVRGRIDWQILPREVPIIGDHKTTSSLMWAKSQDDLRTDIQAGCYAHHAHLKTGKERVSLQWNYVTTGAKPETRPVHVEVGYTEVARTLALVEATGLDMLEKRRTFRRALDYPMTVSSCEKYGGCPFKVQCGLSPTHVREALFAELRDEALAKRGILHTTTAEERKPMAVSSVLANIQAKRKAITGEAAAEAAAAPPKINAGDLPPPPPAPKFVDGAWVTATFDRQQGEWVFPPEPAAPPPPPPPPAQETPPAAEAPKAETRVPRPNLGRPRGSKNKPADGAAGGPNGAAATPAPETDAPAAADVPATPTPEPQAQTEVASIDKDLIAHHESIFGGTVQVPGDLSSGIPAGAVVEVRLVGLTLDQVAEAVASKIVDRLAAALYLSKK